MAEKITMPRLSDTMEEGTVVKWHKNVGDKVSEGEILVEIETDKAIQDFESEFDGVLLYRGVEEGHSAPVESLLMVIGEEGEEFSLDDTEEKPKEEEKSNIKQEEKPKEAAPAKSSPLPDGVNIVTMPRLSDTMEEGTVVKWHKKLGDTLSEGDIVAEIETDKAVQEFENEYEGSILYIGVEEGASAPVESVLYVVGPAGTDVSGVDFSAQGEETSAEAAEAPKEKPAAASVAPRPAPVSGSTSKGGRIFASPLAKKMAEEKGIDLSLVNGTGDNGRIIKRDIENYTPAAAPATTVTAAAPSFGFREDTVIPNSQMRKTIARRLGESKYSAPHYYLNVSVNMGNCISSRKKINEANPENKISFNDIIIKAVAMALRQHPQVNSTWSEQETVIHGDINIGVAVAVDEGLLVPVTRNTDFLTFSEISAQVKELAGKARERKLKPEEMEGSTFTVSNLGMFGIESFTSIINQPNSSILSVGAIVQKPIVENGEIVIGNMMSLSMACDHRTVDGATGAKFLQTLVMYLENPVSMLF